MIKIMSFLWLFVATAFAAFNGPEWDEYRIETPNRAPLPVHVPKLDDEVTLHSIGDEKRLDRHRADMKAFFAIPKILETWGGINAREDSDEAMNAMIDRWANRAQQNLPSWRLVYYKDALIGVVASHVGLYKGSPYYDGGAELIACTHPDYWRRGVANAVVRGYIENDLLPSPKFRYLWTSADPANAASIQGVLAKGFTPWDEGCFREPDIPTLLNIKTFRI